MAFLDNMRNRLPIFGAQPNPPSPTDGMLGHTPQAPDIDQQPPPPVHQLPLGASGRANFYGLPEIEELNRKLVGTEGLRRYDDMYHSDPHIRRLILMAWAPILSGTWTLEPYGGDKASDSDRQAADAIWWGLTKWMSPNFYEHLTALGPVLLRSGFCAFEQIWGSCQYEGKQLTFPRKLDMRLPRSVWKWWQDDFGELTHIGQILPSRADVVIPMTQLVYYRLAPEGDNWAGTSLLRHCYKPWYYKDKLERLDAIGQERKAVGVPVVYPPKGADSGTKAEVEKILANLHVSEVAYVMMPGPHAGKQGAPGVPQDEWDLEIVTFDSSSGSGIQDSLTYHQSAINSSFALDFMALGQHQVGARATAEIQEDPYLAAVESLIQLILSPLNRLIQRIAEVNYGDKLDGAPELSVSLSETASESEIAAYVQAMVTAEVITPDEELEEWARERADMPPVNADVRKLRTQAQKAGLEQSANPPDPLELAKAKAAGTPPGKTPPPDPNPKKPGASASGKQLSQEPSARWFDRLLSQDKLRQAFDGARDHIEASVGPAAVKAARQAAYETTQTGRVGHFAPQELTDALTQHYEQMYHLGHQTVTHELQKQRASLGRKLDGPTDASTVVAGRLARARQRGEHSARNIMNRVGEVLGRQRITGLKQPTEIQTAAERAAKAQLRVEALSNTAASVNDGRYDGAMSAGDVVGGVYTSVMDERSCDPCIDADTGDILSPEEAVGLGPPNPDCEGGEYCRCAIVWTVSTDPAAMSMVA